MPSVPSTAEPAAHQRRKAERPQELLDAALALFVEHGFAATRTEAVAKLAGVSKGTLYLYYASKEELFKAVVRHFLADEIARGAAAAAAFEGSTPDLLRQVCADWWLSILDSPVSGVFKLVITEMRNFPELAEFYRDEVILPGQQALRAMVLRGVARGEFAPTDLSALETAVQSLLLPMVMLCLHKHSLGACLPPEALAAPEHFVRGHIELLLRGLLAKPDAA
jgi:TetR/AcrR family transcriptional regulator